MDKELTKTEYYALYYAERLHPPCDKCSPLYKAGYTEVWRCIENENWGKAYALAEQMDEMTGRGLLE